MASASKNVQRIGKELSRVSASLTPGKYTQFSNLKGYIIYCDPPYSQYSDYYEESGNGDRSRIKFDHEAFWDWCREMAKDNIVFVSEYSAPSDFEVVKKVKSNISHGRHGKVDRNTEKLFVIY